jgi:2-methylcitrate dehydratase PrpD
VREVLVRTNGAVHNIIGSGANDPEKYNPDASRETLDHSLSYTVAVALDVGPGVVRMLFEDRIQRTILSTPQKIRDYLASSAVAKNR